MQHDEARIRDGSRQVSDLQLKCEELAGRCEAAERSKQQIQEQLAAAEVCWPSSLVSVALLL